MKKNIYQELAALFFETRQIIRCKLPQGQADPNAWLRFETLRFVVEHGEPTMREIATHLRITAPSATSLVANLCSLGLIERKQAQSDKRIVRIALSAAGKKEFHRYNDRSITTMKNVFSKLPAHDVRELTRILRDLRDIHT